MKKQKGENPAPPLRATVQAGHSENEGEGGEHTKPGAEAKDGSVTEHKRTAQPKPDNDAALSFLERWGPPWALTAIHPAKTVKGRDGGLHKVIHGRLFSKDQFTEMAKWIAQHNGTFNVYFAVNRVMREFKQKASREDIKEVAWLHVDIDARAGEPLEDEKFRIKALLTTKLPKDIPPPTVITFSGGGFQAFWKLAEPIQIDGDIAKANDAALYNKQLEIALGGDNCSNVDRIMRLPGTLNIPDAKKLKKGRTVALAAVVEFHG